MAVGAHLDVERAAARRSHRPQGEGVDLVELMIRVAFGETLPLTGVVLTKVDADFLAVNTGIATATFVRRAHAAGKDVYVEKPLSHNVFEGRQVVDWSGFHMGLLRWTLVFNIASAFSLYLFVMAYDADLGGFVAVGAWLLLGLVAGVWLLAHQKTIGLLILAAVLLDQLKKKGFPRAV